MSYAPNQNWELESIFSGGPSGAAFREQFQIAKASLNAIEVPELSPNTLEENTHDWVAFIQKLENVAQIIGTLRAYAHCCWSENAKSDDAKCAVSDTADLSTAIEGLHVALKRAIFDATDEAFENLIKQDALQSRKPMLRDIRRGKHLNLPADQQLLYVELSREALHGWGQLYSLQSGKLKAQLMIDGHQKELSIAELNGYNSNPDASVRREAFDAGQKAWNGLADVCAHTLTQITGARETRNKRLNIDPLAHTLYANRITRETLQALLEASEVIQSALTKYLDRKAKLLGKSELDWWDLHAPIGGGTMATLDWPQAQSLVIDAFGGLYPRLQYFARNALNNRWVEAEARSGKRPGGYCTRIATKRESRIFMSFTNSLNSCMTLAHELGHAYHNELLFQQPPSRMRITMALAETASTFAEALVLDQVLETADLNLKLFLIEQQLQRATTFAMNIPSRFNFEQHLFELRRNGALKPDELSQLVVRCQQQAYKNKLSSYDPTFWCSKLHFYISSFGFYNWPYTFGYLFSAAVYDRFKTRGDAFIPTFEELLLQTGYRWSEEIAEDLLDANLQHPDFWLEAAGPMLTQLDAFLTMTEEATH